MSDLKDKIAQRYLWNDYAHFELNRDGCTNWSYQAIMDVMKLEAENAELQRLLKLVWDFNKSDLDQCVRHAIRDYYDKASEAGRL